MTTALIIITVLCWNPTVFFLLQELSFHIQPGLVTCSISTELFSTPSSNLRSEDLPSLSFQVSHYTDTHIYVFPLGLTLSDVINKKNLKLTWLGHLKGSVGLILAKNSLHSFSSPFPSLCPFPSSIPSSLCLLTKEHMMCFHFWSVQTSPWVVFLVQLAGVVFLVQQLSDKSHSDCTSCCLTLFVQYQAEKRH